MDSIEQEESRKKTNNPNGIGGFQDHPELINKGGRPKNEVSIIYWIKKYLSEAEVGHEMERAQELAIKMTQKAFVDGDSRMMEYITDKIDGKAVQKVDLDVVGLKEIADLLQKAIEDEPQENNQTINQ